jgi:hypothetical protein
MLENCLSHIYKRVIRKVYGNTNGEMLLIVVEILQAREKIGKRDTPQMHVGTCF